MPMRSAVHRMASAEMKPCLCWMWWRIGSTAERFRSSGNWAIRLAASDSSASSGAKGGKCFVPGVSGEAIRDSRELSDMVESRISGKSVLEQAGEMIHHRRGTDVVLAFVAGLEDFPLK